MKNDGHQQNIRFTIHESDIEKQFQIAFAFQLSRNVNMNNLDIEST